MRQAPGHFLPSSDALQVLDAGATGFYLADHAVECTGQSADFVRSPVQDARIEITQAHLACCRRQLTQATDYVSSQHQTQAQGNQSRQAHEHRKCFEICQFVLQASLFDTAIGLQEVAHVLLLVETRSTNGEDER